MSKPADPKGAGDPQPQEALLEMVSGYIASQVINVAARLGIADVLRDGAKTSEEVATATGTHASSLHRLLRALACIGVLAEVEPGRFDLTSLGVALQTEAPNSMRSLAMLLCDEAVWRAWGNLLHSVQTGAPAFEQVVGMGSFEYLAQNPELSATFNKAMAEYTRHVAPGVVAGYDFSRFRTIVDVGGGNGTLIAAILEANPGLRGILFDTPAGLEAARENLQATDVADRCQIFEGDFFESVPDEGDVYILKSVIHDWDDDRSIAILRNCRRAMPPDGKLLLVEPVLPPTVASAAIMDIVMSDLNMLVNTGGSERTEAEFQALFAAAGFTLTAVIPTLEPSLSLVEGVPVSHDASSGGVRRRGRPSAR